MTLKTIVKYNRIRKIEKKYSNVRAVYSEKRKKEMRAIWVNPSGTGRGFLIQAGSGIFSRFIAPHNRQKFAERLSSFLAGNRIFLKVMPLTSIASA
jgi:hypothetical protein